MEYVSYDSFNRIFKVSTAVLMKIQVFLDVTTCRMVNSNPHFAGSRCLSKINKSLPVGGANIAEDEYLFSFLFCITPLQSQGILLWNCTKAHV
jgi:hypothetical protein